HMRGGVCLQAAGVLGFSEAFVAAPGVPEISARAQVLPFFGVGNRNSAADIAAEGDAARVVGRAEQAAVEARCGSVEAGVKRRDVEGRPGHAAIVSGKAAV